MRLSEIKWYSLLHINLVPVHQCCFPVTILERSPILNSSCWWRITFSMPTTKFLFENIDGSFISDYFVNIWKVDFLICLLIYIVKTIEKFIGVYKITKNVFSNSITRKYLIFFFFFSKSIILIYFSFLIVNIHIIHLRWFEIVLPSKAWYHSIAKLVQAFHW